MDVVCLRRTYQGQLLVVLLTYCACEATLGEMHVRLDCSSCVTCVADAPSCSTP